nr:MAG TPA: Receptor Binding Protein [Caudoviricetes sp.]
MSIITYPLNGVTYDAEDVSTYLCTRTSGVYAKDSNYAVSVTGPRQITVAPGLAWINYDDFKGVSACSREAVNLTVPDADSTLPRIDRVVLQFDTAANLTAVKLKPGPPAAAPEPPAILQNHNQYELGLCTVSVPAGSSVVTAADITDTRAAEDVCGVMRDGVTGIPTAQLQAQALAIMTQLSTELHTKLDALDAAIAAVESGSFYTKAEADQKFGTPYTLPPATADQLGGVKVGDYLDIAADGTLSGKTLYDTIAASVAVKSEARLVWSGKTTIVRRKTQTINVQDGVDYVNLRVNEADFNLTPGMAHEANISGAGSLTVTVLFSADKKRLECTLTNTLNTVSVVFTGYHYPTLAELLTETQSAQADTDALAVDQEYRVAMLELGLTDDTTTDTTT